VSKKEEANSVVIFEENEGLRLVRSTDADGLELEHGGSVVVPTCCRISIAAGPLYLAIFLHHYSHLLNKPSEYMT
jgi:hypothetical protein